MISHNNIVYTYLSLSYIPVSVGVSSPVPMVMKPSSSSSDVKQSLSVPTSPAMSPSMDTGTLDSEPSSPQAFVSRTSQTFFKVFILCCWEDKVIPHKPQCKCYRLNLFNVNNDHINDNVICHMCRLKHFFATMPSSVGISLTG